MITSALLALGGVLQSGTIALRVGPKRLRP